MFVETFFKAANKLENPEHPLLGPNIQGLYFFGLWLQGSKFHKYAYCLIHLLSGLFVISEFIDLYQMRTDMMKVLLNISITGFGLIAFTKTVAFIILQAKWTKIAKTISEEEMLEIERKDPNTTKIMAEYKTYARTITYMYWLIVLMTIIATITSPALRYISSSQYREEILNGTESRPFILSSWFPFNKNQMPGYAIATMVHIYITFQGAGVVATFDTNAVAIMTFLKGQAIILKYNCRRLFGEEQPISKKEVLIRIKECHRLHNLFMETYAIFNAALSPVMFMYVLVCSITMCCGVVQLTSKEVRMFQKMWVVEFVSTQLFQLFMYCWHSNEIGLEMKILIGSTYYYVYYDSAYNKRLLVTTEFYTQLCLVTTTSVTYLQINLSTVRMTDAVSRSIFESKYWRSDLQERKLLLLLAGKMRCSYLLEAGPFTNLSILTFIDILKGTYSFYTLFTQMQEN